jgi:hypothetical protein
LSGWGVAAQQVADDSVEEGRHLLSLCSLNPNVMIQTTIVYLFMLSEYDYLLYVAMVLVHVIEQFGIEGLQ